MDWSNVDASMISSLPESDSSRTSTVTRFTGRLVTPPASVQVGGVPVGTPVSSWQALSTTSVCIQYVRPSGPVTVAAEGDGVTIDAHEALVSIDGREDRRIDVGDVVEVRALERPMRFVEPAGALPFWDLLRTKVELLPS